MIYYFDPTYILVIIGAIICLWASARVNSTYNKYARVRSTSDMTGAEAAEEILRRNNIYDISIQHVSGNLTDHFDPRNRTVNLSDTVYNSTSVAAVGVAAHECGHVLQDEQGYVPLKVRSALVPVANFGSNVGIWMVILGLIFSFSQTFVNIGIFLFSFSVLFQLVTLPVEFNASHRALRMLTDYGILNPNEEKQTRSVLSAAAMTYVAAAASSILTLLRLILLNKGRSRDD